MSNLLVDIVTGHSCDIKTLFDVLNGILHEIKIDFIKDKESVEVKKKKNTSDSDSDNGEVVKKPSGKGGIRILALDQNQTLLVYVKLNSEQFVKFDVKYPMYSIGLDLSQLQKFLRTIDKESIMRLSIDKDNEHEIKFSLENNSKNNNSTYTQKILDIDDDAKKLPEETSFELSVIIDTVDFHKICREMINMGEYVEITCTSKEITFKCQGDQNAYTKSFKHSESGVRIICLNDKKNIIVQAIYELKNLANFGKAVHLSDEMQLYLKNDWPLFIHYMVGTLGKMLVGLSPVDEKRIKKDKDYDDKLDKYYTESKTVIKKN
jgi:proliferating cell nuclear antigen